MRLPSWLLRHTIVFERYAGDSAYGPTFEDPVTVRAFVDDRRRLVRASDGSEAVAETTVFIAWQGLEVIVNDPNVTVNALGVGVGGRFGSPTPIVTPGSRITLGTRASTVMAVSAHAGFGLPVPDHVEIALQ